MKAATLDITTAARDGNYAVGAFNVFDYVSMKAVIDAAARLHSPAIIQISARTAKAIGPVLIAQMFSDLAARVDVPLALHLDHCPDVQLISDVIDAGWQSVLFDASHLDFDEARQLTRAVVAKAHPRGVAVESEIENILGVEDGVGSNEARHAYSVEQLVETARYTHTDLLAPQLGTAHGLYTSDPVLHPERVTEIRALTNMPIVLHGGTGLSAAEFRAFIGAGVSKINISTQIKRSYMSAALAELESAREAERWEPLPVFDAVAEAVSAAVEPLLRVFAGKAV